MTFFDLRRVQVLCSCNRSCPLANLYFCRHCFDVRCGNCVSHEVDSNYCPNCLENMASAEAKMRKHRCGNCYDCPSCGHTLSTRATLALVPSGGGKLASPGPSTAQKAYYLICPFCNWSTRNNPSISDQKTPAGAWSESPNPHAQRIEELVAAYRQLAQKEKNDSQRSKYVRKRNYMMLMSRFPVLTPRFRRSRSSAFVSYGSSKDEDEAEIVKILKFKRKDTEPTPDIHIPGVEAKPIDDIFNVQSLLETPLHFEHMTSMFQRCLMPASQDAEVTKLEPRHMALAVKRSLRCRKCEHNLSKADFNPSAIKFRINLSAFYHVPDLRFALPPDCMESPPSAVTVSSEDSKKAVSISESGIVSAMSLAASNRLPIVTFASVAASPFSLQGFKPGKTTTVIFTICNPAHRITTVRLRQLTPDEETSRLAAFFAFNPSQMTSPPDCKNGAATYSTVELALPSYGIRLAAKSDVTEYDDLNVDTSKEFPGDDQEIISFRRGNKVGVNVGVLVKKGSEGGQLRAALNLSFDYKNVTNAILSEQRANAASAVLAASGIRDGTGKKTGESPVSKPITADYNSELEDIHQIDVVVLIDFGTQKSA